MLKATADDAPDKDQTGEPSALSPMRYRLLQSAPQTTYFIVLIISGKWKLSSTCQSIELVRRSILDPHGAFFIKELTSDGSHTLFIASHKFRIEKELHYIRRVNVWGSYKPYRFEAWVSGLGKSSFSVCQNMYDHNSGQKLYSATSVMVFSDWQTRKASKLPNWFVSRAEEYLKTINPVMNHVIEKSSDIHIPKDSFSYEIKALQSDCDQNNHVNQAAYIKWCSNVGALAVDAEIYKSFKKDIRLYALEELHVQYIGETFMDETVVVYTWENTNERNAAHFVMKKEETIIFKAKLKYYEVILPHSVLPKL